MGDHPRGCGAHSRVKRPTTIAWGSSPRVRGSLLDAVGRLVRLRIIPAGAGLTEIHHRESRASGDHPRGCGAHLSALYCGTIGEGSSPRVRGSPQCESVESATNGIIPAGAGLTSPACLAIIYRWDHPRGCGAHLRRLRKTRPCTGSSPLVRGSLWFHVVCTDSHGIIPAGAGLTLYQVV